MSLTAIATIIAAIVSSSATSSSTSQSIKATEKAQGEARRLDIRDRSDRLRQEEAARVEAAKSRKLTKDELSFRQKEAGLNRAADKEQTSYNRLGDQAAKFSNLLNQDQNLSNNLSNLWKNRRI